MQGRELIWATGCMTMQIIILMPTLISRPPRIKFNILHSRINMRTVITIRVMAMRLQAIAPIKRSRHLPSVALRVLIPLKKYLPLKIPRPTTFIRMKCLSPRITMPMACNQTPRPMHQEIKVLAVSAAISFHYPQVRALHLMPSHPPRFLIPQTQNNFITFIMITFQAARRLIVIMAMAIQNLVPTPKIKHGH